MCVFPVSVAGAPIHLNGLHVPYDTLMCTLHLYKPTVQPVASRSLFLDIQVVALLLGEYTLFACVYTSTTGCKRGYTDVTYKRPILHYQHTDI